MTKKAQIEVHQAFYGELNHSHGCLFSTIVDKELNTFLTGFSDRPSAVPAGIDMQPYYSALAHGNHYVFTLTFPDHTAPRAGMVFTHVLIIDINDIEYVNNLNSLFGYFCKTIPENKTAIQKLVIPVSSLSLNEVLGIFPEYIIQATKGLTSGALPLVFCGELKSFIRLISSIWAGIPLSFRIKMSFTVGFSTTNIDASKTVIHFQKNLGNILRNIEYVSDMATHLVEVDSTIEKYILTPLSDNQFDIFIKDLNVDLTDWSILQLCAKAFEGYQNYTELNNDALKQLIRQLAKISPNNNDGKSIKGKIINEIEQRIIATKETNLKSLKNLPLNAFDSGENIISMAVKSFVDIELTKKEDSFNGEQISEVLILAKKEVPSNWWHNAIKNALRDTIKHKLIDSIKNIWRLLSISKEALHTILSFFPNERSYELLFIEHIPHNIAQRFAENVAQVSQEKQWILLHAHLISTYLSPEESLKQQLSLEKDLMSNSFQGSDLLAKNTSDEKILTLAIESNETFFITEYANRSIKNPTLLKDLDIRNQTWLSIWKISLQKTNNLEYGVLEVSDKINLLLNHLAEGAEVPHEIIDHIANSKFADISDLKNRASLWKYLPVNTKNLFLEATSNRIVKKVSSEGIASLAIEHELVNYISSDKSMTAILRTYRADMDTVLEIYEYFVTLKDSFLADYIKYYPNNLNDIQSNRLGNLVVAKRFHLSARQIFEKAKHNTSFKIALTKCQSIANIGFWDKLSWDKLIGETVSVDSVYSELVRITVKLYDKGPEDNDIWKRAGGEISKLHSHISREDNWRNAINLLRNGGGGKGISVKSLIKEMIEDHPNNTELKEIKKYFKLI